VSCLGEREKGMPINEVFLPLPLLFLVMHGGTVSQVALLVAALMAGDSGGANHFTPPPPLPW
jgi:hypothetical protein